MRIQIMCPKCSTTLSCKKTFEGKNISCPTCKTILNVPFSKDDSQNEREDKSNDDHYESSTSSLKTFFTICISALTICICSSIIFFVFKYLLLGSISLIISLLMALFLVKLLFDFYSAKATAIRTGRREIDVFFGFAKLVLWEENEGLLFLKNKRIDSLVFGPDDGGGMKFIYPFFGEEIKVHVPLTLQLCEFQDRKVLTRESIQLFVKVAIWWRIKDRKGLEKFYLLISKEIDVINDSGLTQHRDYSNGASQRLPVARRVEPKKAELSAAQQWLLNLAESSIRKIISKTSVASVISNRASQYLHASHNVNPSNQSPLKTDFQLMATSADNAATPDSLGLELKDALTPVVMNYGLDIERIEVQEIQLPGDIQEAIDRVWKASLLPAQSAQESAARYNHIKAELDAVKDVIGVDAAAIDHVMKNFKGANFVGGFPRILEQLMTNSAPTLVKGIPSKKQPKKAE